MKIICSRHYNPNRAQNFNFYSVIIIDNVVKTPEKTQLSASENLSQFQSSKVNLCGIKRRKISESSEALSDDSDPTPKRGKDNKKEKNRQAAIECRKKRKEYVSTLEDAIK